MSEHREDERIGVNTGAALLAGKYEIIEDISRGGFGRVVKVRQVDLDKIFAAKVIVPEQAGPDSIKRLVREGQILNKLKHPNLVEVVSSAMDEHQGLVLVMQFIDGKPLSKMVPLPVERAVDLAQQICSGLACAHANGVLHRDLKPSNVMIVEREGKQQAVVIDFGIAKATANQKLTSTGAILGTPLYMSPEQFIGKQTEATSDVYSFGCVLYEMLTGRPPFQGENAVELAAKHNGELPVPPSELSKGVSEALDDIVLRCLAKAPQERYQSMEAIGEDLAAADLRAGSPPSKGRKKRGPLVPVRPRMSSMGKLILISSGLLVTFACVAAGLHFAVGEKPTDPPEAIQATEKENSIDRAAESLQQDPPVFDYAGNTCGKCANELEQLLKFGNQDFRLRVKKLILRARVLESTCNLMKVDPGHFDAERRYADAFSSASAATHMIERDPDMIPSKVLEDKEMDLGLLKAQANAMLGQLHDAVVFNSGTARRLDYNASNPNLALYRMRLNLVRAEIASREGNTKDAAESAKDVKEALSKDNFARTSLDQDVEAKLWTAYAKKRLQALHLE
jgi:serine/threonine protein kinase